jgi:hypothetical protein
MQFLKKLSLENMAENVSFIFPSRIPTVFQQHAWFIARLTIVEYQGGYFQKN